MAIEYFFGLLILSCIGAYFTWRNGHKVRLATAAAAFRTAINPDFIGELRGHALVSALLGAHPGTGSRIEGIYRGHKRAFREFRNYLGLIDRHRLDRAWEAYHGGNEEGPDFFVMYGIPSNGHELLKHRLESLRVVGSQT